MRLPQHYIVPGEAINAWQSMLPTGTLGQWLTQTFQPDEHVIELFPSLEMPMLFEVDPPLQFPLEDSAAVDPTTPEPFSSTPKDVNVPPGAIQEKLGNRQPSPFYWQDSASAYGQGMANLYTDLSPEEQQHFDESYDAFLEVLMEEQAGGDIDPKLIDKAFPKPGSKELWAEASGMNVQFLKLDRLYTPLDQMTGLKAALGSQPVLIYRLLPALLHPVGWRFAVMRARSFHAIQNEDEYYRIVPRGQVKAEMVARATGLPTSYGSDSVYPYYSDQMGKSLLGDELGKGKIGLQGFVERNRIISLSIEKDEDDRINGVWVKGPLQPNSQMAPYGYLGDPAISRFDHRRHGLRMYDIEWPFLQSSGQNGESEIGALKQKITAMCEVFFVMLANFTYGGMQYGRATAELDYEPLRNPGSYMVLEMPETPTTKYKSGNRSRNLNGGDLKDHVPNYSREGASSADEDRSPGGLSGYCETVTHIIQVNQRTGAVSASTTCQLSRVAELEFGRIAANFPLRDGTKLFVLSFRLIDNAFIEYGGLSEDGVFMPAVAWDAYTETDESIKVDPTLGDINDSDLYDAYEKEFGPGGVGK